MTGMRITNRRHSSVSVANIVKISLVSIFLIVVAGYFLFPVVWMLIASTKNTASLFSTGLLALPKQMHFLSNLIRLSTFQGGIYWRWYLNSIIYSSVVAVLTCFVSSMAAVSLAKYDFRGKEGIFKVILASLMVPGTVIAIPLFIIEGPLALRDSFLGVILPLIVSPFGVYFLRIYIRDVVPDEILDAASVDGASTWLVYWKFILPLIRPAMTTLFLISFIGTWNNFFIPLVLLHNDKLYPVTLGIESWTSLLTTPAAQQVGWYPLIIMGALVSILPMIIGFLFVRKNIVTGLASGSVKL